MKKKTFEISVGGKDYKVDVDTFDGKRASVKVDGKPYEVEVKKETGLAPQPAPLSPPTASRTAPAAPEAPQAPTASAPSGGEVIAPMPGLILELMVAVGDTVTAGMPVIKMEAMKMENEIPSPANGTVKSIAVKVGDNVQTDETLMVIEET